MLSKKKLAKHYGDKVVWYDKRRRLGLRLSFTHYILTDKKLYVRTGFLSVKEESLELYKILDFTLNLPLGQRIFGCGTLVITSKDKTSPRQELTSIRCPRAALRYLENTTNAERERYGVYGRDMVGAVGHDYDIDCNHGLLDETDE